MRAPSIKNQALLSSLPLFQSMEPEVLDRIAEGTTRRRAAKGQFIFRRGDPCTGFHAVIDGQVKLVVISAKGAERVLDVVRSRQSFGNAAMFTGFGYPMHAQALVDTSTLYISSDVVFAELERNPRLAQRMLISLSQEVLDLLADLEDCSIHSAAQRVGSFLLHAVDSAGRSDQPAKLRLDTGKGVIASRLNLTPEHFSRILGVFAHDGMISVSGPEILIRDPGRIRALLH